MVKEPKALFAAPLEEAQTRGPAQRKGEPLGDTLVVSCIRVNRYPHATPLGLRRLGAPPGHVLRLARAMLHPETRNLQTLINP